MIHSRNQTNPHDGNSRRTSNIYPPSNFLWLPLLFAFVSDKAILQPANWIQFSANAPFGRAREYRQSLGTYDILLGLEWPIITATWCHGISHGGNRLWIPWIWLLCNPFKNVDGSDYSAEIHQQQQRCCRGLIALKNDRESVRLWFSSSSWDWLKGESPNARSGSHVFLAVSKGLTAFISFQIKTDMSHWL